MSGDPILDAIRLALRHEIDLIAEEEIGKAQAHVRERVAAQMDRLALSVLQLYAIERRENRLIIEVRKPAA